MPEEFFVVVYVFNKHRKEHVYEPSLSKTMAEYGGVLPLVGDMIVDGGVQQGKPRTPENKSIYEVTARYFIEHESRWVLLVNDRPGRLDESEILGA